MGALRNAYFPTQRMCAFGPEGKPVFWVIEVKETFTPDVAFSAKDRSGVETSFCCDESGAECNGEPGLRHNTRALLRRLCDRPGWQQHRGSLSHTGVTGHSRISELATLFSQVISVTLSLVFSVMKVCNISSLIPATSARASCLDKA